MSNQALESLKIAPHYEISRELGVGGMGRVVLAQDTRLERHVAIKVLHRSPDQLHSQANERFLHEARAVAKLSHPNIVSIYDVGSSDGAAYMVMEYLQGRSLEQMILEVPRIPVSLCAAVGVQICAALDYTHQRGIIHRDIKPANIIMSRDGVAKLTDFGVVKMTGSGLASLEESGATVGTLKYASPEQLLDASQVGPSSDIYSLAVTIFELLTGEHPYEAASVTDFIRKVFDAQTPALRDVFWDIPESLEQILLKAMARDPAERYQRAAELGEALAEMVDNNSLQRILTGPLFNMRSLLVSEAPPLAAANVTSAEIGSTHTDLRLVPEAKRLLGSLRHDLSWLLELSRSLTPRESFNLPKTRFLERVLSSGFSGLIQINDTVWALVQNGYFLEFLSGSLTPRIDKTGDEIFEILPEQLNSVRLYPLPAEKQYLPLLMANLLQERGNSTADDAALKDLSSWPQLLENLPDLSGCLICKNAETLYCLGYANGKQIMALELHPEAVRLADISLQHILGRSHTLWDFYHAEVCLSALNQDVLLRHATGYLTYREPGPTLELLSDPQVDEASLLALSQNLRFDYRFAIQTADTQILADTIGAAEITRRSRLHRFMGFWLSELLPLLYRGHLQERFDPLLSAARQLSSWSCHLNFSAAGQRIGVDLCAYDAEGQIQLCLRQGEGDSAGVQAWLRDLALLQAQHDFSRLQAAILIAPGAYTLDALALYARSVTLRQRQGQSVPGIPKQAAGETYQLCLVEYAQHEKQFKLVAPSLYG
ncbi:MAG: hypothetical protein CVV27_13930 [Candidatus Melainabacteria bacterium HGW-Melainabacteria-1]|nr:MAG: hypothetical protein CVV27_13930 [Candidatus Melainabacteria bacterium HGW-Melainabacteria-1]